MEKVCCLKNLLGAFIAFSSVQLVFAEDEVKLPDLQYVEREHDFGTVSQGDTVEHEFVLRNGGTADLLIQKIVPSCGCTAASTTNNVIAPGGEGTIRVSFDTTGFSGNKVKTVRLFTNDRDDPTAMVTLRGIIEPDVSVEPKRIFLGEVVKGSDPLEQTVTVRVRDGGKARIDSIRSFSKHLQVKELGGNDMERKFAVSVLPSAPVGELRERVIVSLNGGKEGSMNVPVYASIKGSIRLLPGTLSFGLIEGKNVIEKTVKLENKSSRDLSIEEVRVSDDALSASVTPVKKGKIYVVHVKVDPAKLNKDLRASIEIITDSEQQRSLTLSVFGVLPPRVGAG